MLFLAPSAACFILFLALLYMIAESGYVEMLTKPIERYGKDRYQWIYGNNK